MIWLSLSLIALACVAVLLTIAYALALGIGPLPTSQRVAVELRKLLPSDVERVVELGCGFGSLLPVLASYYPGKTIVGYERSPLPWLIAALRSCFHQNCTVLRRCLFEVDHSKAQLVVCYLFPSAMRRLADQLRRELMPGAYVLTHTFALPGWQPLHVVQASDLYRTPVYLYRKESIS